mgnify:CR=1 FL=1
MRFHSIRWYICLSAFAYSLLHAQTPVHKFTLKECLNTALAHNAHIRSAALTVDYFKTLVKTSSELPKTSVVYTQGQFNSIYKYDNNITISQTIPNPLVFSTHHALARSQVKSSEFHYEATKAELIHRIEVCYYSLLYSNAVHHLIHREDSIYEVFAKDVSAKFDLGQATVLEKTTAETQAIETKNQLIESEEDIRNYQIELQTLLQVNTEVEIADEDFDKSFLSVEIDSGRLREHPHLQFYRQEIEVMDKLRKNERAHALPDFFAGYFNQTIYGPANIFGTDYFLTTKNRLQGFQAGLSVPLWFMPAKARVKAARIHTQIAESDYQSQRILLEGQYKQAVTMYLKYHNSITYYQNKVINNLDVIVEQALKSYDAKTISYVDYLQVVSHALQFERNYLNVIHQNNMQALMIRYLSGKIL